MAPTWWPTARAALITAHLVAIGVCAFPAPVGGMNRSSWRDPTVHAELEAWRARLGDVGLQRTSKQFEDDLWRAMTEFMAVREAVVSPFDRYYALTGTWQSWRMFVAPQRYPARLSVDVYEDGSWKPLFEERSDTATWHRELFDHDRLRAAIFRYSWPKFSREWRVFADWLGERAAQERPQAEKLRARFYRYRTLSPQEAAAGVELDGKFEHEVVIDLASKR